jgi:hypothetical protein
MCHVTVEQSLEGVVGMLGEQYHLLEMLLNSIDLQEYCCCYPDPARAHHSYDLVWSQVYLMDSADE